MDIKEDIVPKEDSLNIIAAKMELELEKFLPSLQEVKEEFIDEESTWGNFLYEAEASEVIGYKPRYNSEYDSLQHVKNELCDDEQMELTCHSGNRIVFEDDGMLNYVEDEQEHNNNNAKESFFLNAKKENREYEVTIKTERLEDSDVLNEVDKTSVHYDILVTPKLVQCKRCDRIFKNRFHLLKHNIGHMKLNINITSLISNNSDDKIVSKNKRESKRKHSKLYHCKECNSRMQYCNMQRHIETVHSSTEAFCCDLCDKEFRCIKYLKKHIISIHKSHKSNSVKCQYCGKSFKHKYNLTCHIKNCHSNERLQCDFCDKVFKSKPYLLTHIKRIHQDYGKVFECWCGKEFLTPRRLAYHKRARHG